MNVRMKATHYRGRWSKVHAVEIFELPRHERGTGAYLVQTRCGKKVWMRQDYPTLAERTDLPVDCKSCLPIPPVTR